MGGFIRSDVERIQTRTLNTAIEKTIYEAFKASCKRKGYPLNVIIDLFMDFFVNNEITIDPVVLERLKQNSAEKIPFSTTISADGYQVFKNTCKRRGYKVNGVLSVFMDAFSKGNFVLDLKLWGDSSFVLESKAERVIF